MPDFSYRGVTTTGKKKKGTHSAENVRAARSELRKKGVFVTEITESSKKKLSSGSGLDKEFDFSKLFSKIKIEDVAGLTRQLGTLIKAGVPLTESLGALCEQNENHLLREILQKVRQTVNEGSSLADALSPYPKVFSSLYVNMVRGGETAGNLDSVLHRLADFQEKRVALRNKVRSATRYPQFMLIASLGITYFLLATVVPKITEVFKDSDSVLPWNTRLLITISNLATTYWWLVAIIIVATWFFFRRWKNSERGRRTWDAMVLRIWLIGPLLKMAAIARFTRSLGTMLASGVPLLKCLDIVKSIFDNVVLEEVVEKARDAIREGESISKPLKESGYFPPTVTQMIAVGERSGQLEGMLETVADSYDNIVDTKVAGLTSILAPIIILLMGIVVGFIVLSIMMPIMQMNDVME